MPARTCMAWRGAVRIAGRAARPFQGGNRNELRELVKRGDPPPAAPDRRHRPPQLDRICLKAMAKRRRRSTQHRARPGRRPAAVAEPAEAGLSSLHGHAATSAARQSDCCRFADQQRSWPPPTRPAKRSCRADCVPLRPRMLASSSTCSRVHVGEAACRKASASGRTCWKRPTPIGLSGSGSSMAPADAASHRSSRRGFCRA